MIPRRQSAFTLIELLVVAGVLAILIGAIIGVSASVLAGGKARDTEAMLLILDQAIDQFHEDMLERPRFSGSTRAHYDTRYGAYPPDELEAFTAATDFNPTTFLPTISPGGANLTDDGGSSLNLVNVQNRSTKAMALAIKLYSPAGSEILDRISDRFRRTMGNPHDDFHADDNVEQLNRTVPEPLVYFVDAWGTPIEYFATNDTTVTATPTDSADLRRNASTAFIRVNNDSPLLVSYGPDGPDQFSPDFADTDDEPFDLVKDFNQIDPVRTIDHRLNADNVYSNPDIADKLAAELPVPDP